MISDQNILGYKKDNELLVYNKLGLIPGPNENEKDFFKRADYCLKLKTDLDPEFGKLNLPVSHILLQHVVPLTQKLFDIAQKRFAAGKVGRPVRLPTWLAARARVNERVNENVNRNARTGALGSNGF